MGGFKKKFGPDAPMAMIMLAPNLILAAIFIVYAIIYSFYLSFHNVDLFAHTFKFVGFENYTKALIDPLFAKMLKNTFMFVLFTVPFGMAISLVVAVLLNNKIKGRMFIRASFFLPTILPIVAIAQVWNWIYEPSYGLLNYFLQMIGISDPSKPIQWLASPNTAMTAVIIFSIWKSFGYNMILYLAALQGISRQLYEAAEIDGANSMRKFFHITIPGLRPATFFVLITSINGSFQAFDQIYVLTQGGPINSTNVIAYYIYQYAFEFFNIGRGAAVSILLFILLFAIAIWQWRSYQTKEE
ncbi:multiple sugar transport system permease protein [Pullulanibacillus pueri]|uniref:Sugar ABC transporter permease n=1 Tax=Pullulanibacillus pueri TaxID=1437324 RepID=A0A8J2ZY86_9BACL|nr:sugar ABC transporter permease [Pullulanibacillus pueri]MBM7683305.1 multiple sugar transport system permease protein [Pullulanibacillus pueri]GGH86448.1 sugar ABC transporter permease [Pullulanibacillus pueri]